MKYAFIIALCAISIGANAQETSLSPDTDGGGDDFSLTCGGTIHVFVEPLDW